MIRSIVKYILLFGFSLLATELILNLLYSPTIEMSKWFSPGIHTPDSSYGYVFTKSYEGWMRHNDKVLLKKLELDSNGFRNTVYDIEPGAKDIVLIGGRSMVFSYGMEDNETIAYHLQKNLSRHTNIYNTAWPGFNTQRNFDVYKENLENKVTPEIIIFSFFNENLSHFRKPYSEMQIVKNEKAGALKNLFYYSNNIVLRKPNNGVLAKRAGRIYFKSLLFHMLTNKLDIIAPDVLDIKHSLLAKNRRVAKDKTTKKINTPDSTQYYFVDYVTFINKYFEEKNQKVLFAFLPLKKKKQDYYDKLVELMPQSCYYIDINKNKFKEIHQETFIARGHYSKKQCEIIGVALAEEVDKILK